MHIWTSWGVLGCPRVSWGIKTDRFRVSAVNVYKIDLPFTRTVARDKHHGLLIAFPNEKIFS